MNDCIYTKTPAACWNDAFPIGNGKMGAMVYGKPDTEIIALNEDTLYTGCALDDNNYEAYKLLPKIRELVLSGKPYEAEKIADVNMTSFRNTQAYQPMGNMYLDFSHGNVDEYSRTLDMSTACVNVSYRFDGVNYKRCVWVGAESGVLIIKLSADKSKSISFSLKMDNVTQYSVKTDSESNYIMLGQCPDDHYPEIVYNGNGTKYEVVAKVIHNGGELFAKSGNLVLNNADSAAIVVASATSFVDAISKADAPTHENCMKKLNKISEDNLEEYLNADIKAHKELYNRVKLQINGNSADGVEVNSLMADAKSGRVDDRLYCMLFNLGRYLLITSSRKGSKAANLQGIWNDVLQPKWASAYTANINLEMNYWSADICNLSECNAPLFDYLKIIYENGKRTAKAFFNCKGWCCGHNADIWGKTSPYNIPGGSQWGLWWMAGVWLCTHIWEHYEYTKDTEFLKEYYPIMRGALEFIEDYLIEHNGVLVTCPSTSPENTYFDEEGNACAVTYASAMDISLIRELSNDTLKAQKVLGIDSGFGERINKMLSCLAELKIDSTGRLCEWGEELPEREKSHRHLSHLFGLYPGHIIDEANPAIYEAAKKSLKVRCESGGCGTGWSAVWLAALSAQVYDPDTALAAIGKWIARMDGNYNLLNIENPYPFQIDANFGYLAAVTNMLLRSDEDSITVLPAIPKSWKTGEVSGLRAKGNRTVNIAWNEDEIRVEIINKDAKKEFAFANMQKNKGYTIRNI